MFLLAIIRALTVTIKKLCRIHDQTSLVKSYVVSAENLVGALKRCELIALYQKTPNTDFNLTQPADSPVNPMLSRIAGKEE